MTRDELRQAAPDMAKFVDGLRDVFGVAQVKITYIKVGDYEAGKKAENCSDAADVKGGSVAAVARPDDDYGHRAGA